MLTLYATALSSPSNKVRFLLHLLKVPYELKHVNLLASEQKSADFLKINAYGKVPAIDDNGFNLAESNAILRYLAEKHNSALYPKNLQERALIDQWLEFSNAYISVAMSKIFSNTYMYKLRKAEKDERALKESTAMLAHYLPLIEQQLTTQSFIAGNQLTLADVAILSALDIAEVINLNLTMYPHLNAWRQNLMQQSFYQECHSSFKDVFDKILGEYFPAN